MFVIVNHIKRLAMNTARRIADSYIRSHLSARELRNLATDDDARLDFTADVAAHLGDHHLLDDEAYSDLVDVATEAVLARCA